MGFIITDFQDESKSIYTTAWNWGPTVELLKLMNVLDEDRLELIRYNCGVEVNTEEARQIAEFIIIQVLSKITPEERVTYDLKITDEPDDGTFHREDLAKNYSATYDWLKEFSEFCQTCEGFTVY